MSRKITLGKADYDISQGNLGKACDRVHGLIRAYPSDLELRTRLAKIYYQAGFLAQAGKYWYLEENKTGEMKAACAEYERYRNNSALAILNDLGFHGDLDAIPGYAKDKLLSLQKESKGKYRFYSKIPTRESKKRNRTFKGKLFAAGCLIVLMIIIALVVIGIMQAYKWLYPG